MKLVILCVALICFAVASSSVLDTDCHHKGGACYSMFTDVYCMGKRTGESCGSNNLYCCMPERQLSGSSVLDTDCHHKGGSCFSMFTNVYCMGKRTGESCGSNNLYCCMPDPSITIGK